MGEGVAAIYVLDRGPYFGIDDVDPWALPRDAREYAGPHPVVAHPPCERWGRYWSGGPSARVRRKLGDDGGCFASALAAVRRWGGVLEHPEASHAWRHHGLVPPPQDGGWTSAGDFLGWTCCVAQGNYGHRAEKLTWLYAFGCELPALKWGRTPGRCAADEDYAKGRDPAYVAKVGIIQRMSKRQRAETPTEFRDMLLNIARSARPR